MVSVNPITSGVSKLYQNCFVKPFVKLSECSPMKAGYGSYRKNNRKIIDGISIASIILKDGVGCYMYVNQSLHNKDIPDDKRKFVAALDLTNGGLMIAAQILMHMTISNKLIQSKMFNRLLGKKFDRNTSKMIHAILKNTDKYRNVSQRAVNEALNKYKGEVCDAFGSLTSLIAATTIGKRIIVPFIATPLAGMVEKRMNKNSNDNLVDRETKNTYDPSKHCNSKNNNKNSALNNSPAASSRPDYQKSNLLNNIKKN